jgi:hypothetical protein
MGIYSVIVSWDNTWRFDYLFRRKYNIPFNSKKHRKMNQIDSRIDLLEDEMFKDYVREDIENNKELEELKKGNWFKPHSSGDFEKDLFDKIKI